MATITEILSHVWPGTEWRIEEDNYETLNWMDGNTVIKPSEAEIRSHSEEVDALINDDEQRSRQQHALNDASDYLLRVVETLIDIAIEEYRVINDLRNTILPAAHTGNFTTWDAAKLSRAQALRQKVINLRSIS